MEQKQPKGLSATRIFGGGVLVCAVISAPYIYFVGFTGGQISLASPTTWTNFATYFGNIATPILTVGAVFIAFRQLKHSEHIKAEDNKSRKEEANKNEALRKLERDIWAYNQDIDFISKCCRISHEAIEKEEQRLEQKFQRGLSSIYLTILEEELKIQEDGIGFTDETTIKIVEILASVFRILSETRDLQTSVNYIETLKRNIYADRLIDELETNLLVKKLNIPLLRSKGQINISIHWAESITQGINGELATPAITDMAEKMESILNELSSISHTSETDTQLS